MPRRRARRLWLGLVLTTAAMVTSVSLWIATRESSRTRLETTAYEARVDAAQEIDGGLAILADRRGSLQSQSVNARQESAGWHTVLDSLQHGAAYLASPSPAHDGVAAALARASVTPVMVLTDSVANLMDSAHVAEARRLVESHRFAQAEQQLRRALGVFSIDERQQQRRRLSIETTRVSRMGTLAVIVATFSLLLLVALVAQLYGERGRREEAEAQARSREQQTEVALRVGHMGWWSWDPDTKAREWSPEMGPLYGHPVGWSPPPGDTIVQMHPDDVDRVIGERNAAFQAGGGSVRPYRIVWPDGAIRWMEAEIVMDYSQGGRPRAMGVVRDVTSAHEAFVERDALVRRMAELLEGLGSGVVLREGPELLPTLMNPAARRMLGITDETYPEYLFGARRIQPLDENGDPVPLSDIAPRRARATGRPQSATYQIRREDGSSAWHHIVAAPLAAKPGTECPVLISITDVSHARAMESQLRDSEERYRAVIASMTEGVVIQDPTGNLVSWNERAEEIMGLTSSQLDGRNARDPRWRMEGEDGALIPPELRPGAVAARERRAVTREIALRSDTGDRQWVRTSAAPLMRDDESEPWGVVLVLTDVTARRRADEVLQDSEARFRHLTEASQDIIFRLDAHFRITYSNPRVREQSDWDPSALIGHDILEFLHPDDAEVVRARRAAGLRDPDGASPTIAVRMRTGSGGYRWFEANVSPQFIAGGQFDGLVATFRDITERRVLDEHLRQTSKLQAVGTLAGGIAHDFNNLLTVIRGSAELLRDVHDEVVSTEVSAIVSAADRGQALTRQLLTFTRQNVEQPAHWEIDALLGECVPLMGRVLQKGQQLVTSFRSPGATLLVDRPSLELALLNLMANARDASGPAGVVQLRTSVVLPMDRRRPPMFADAAVLRIDVEDTGAGFNAAALEHVFEPFFTTKQAGNGTGLGLATAYRVAHAAGGTITVANQTGGGALVSVWLPIASVADVPAEVPAVVAAITAPRRTVLVVEDEAAVRQLTERALGRLGYAVIAAASGGEALDALSNPSTRIDYVLTDYAMPEMTGAQFLELAEHRGLSRPSVLMSGYTADESVRELMGALGTRFLAKPFSLQSLGESLAGLGDEVEA